MTPVVFQREKKNLFLYLQCRFYTHVIAELQALRNLISCCHYHHHPFPYKLAFLRPIVQQWCIFIQGLTLIAQHVRPLFANQQGSRSGLFLDTPYFASFCNRMSKFRVSKAFERSMKTPRVWLFWSSLSWMWQVRSSRA